MELRSETLVLDGYVEWIVWPDNQDIDTLHYGLLELARNPTVTQVYKLDPFGDFNESEYYYTVPKNWEIA